MAFESLQKNIKEVVELLKAYANSNLTYYKLTALKKFAKGGSKLFRLIVYLIFIPLVLLFFSIAAAIYIGKRMDNFYLGFIIIGAVHIILLFLSIIFGGMIVRRYILKKYSRKILKQKNEGTK